MRNNAYLGTQRFMNDIRLQLRDLLAFVASGNPLDTRISGGRGCALPGASSRDPTPAFSDASDLSAPIPFLLIQRIFAQNKNEQKAQRAEFPPLQFFSFPSFPFPVASVRSRVIVGHSCFLVMPFSFLGHTS